MCIYFCFSYKVKGNPKSKSTYKEGIKYIPIATVLGYSLTLSRNALPPQIETNEKTIIASVLVSMISILICFAAIKTTKNRTKGDREYD